MAIDVATAPSPSFSEQYAPGAIDQYRMPREFAEVGIEQLQAQAAQEARQDLDRIRAEQQQPAAVEATPAPEVKKFTPEYAKRFTLMGHALTILREQQASQTR